jgi:hypothetical protein
MNGGVNIAPTADIYKPKKTIEAQQFSVNDPIR